MAHGLFYCGIPAQDCSPHMLGGFKNALSSVGIPLKKGGRLRCQAINLAPPERIRARDSRSTSLSMCDVNVSFPESTSDSLDQLPPEPIHT